MSTKIEWTDDTWNPVTGCSKVSPGCKNCYAETIAKRFWKDRKFTDVRTHEDRLDAPLHWKKPRRVFVNSMSDLFHEDVPYQFIVRVLDVMHRCPQHTFQVLTKRAERMRQVMHDYTVCAPDNLPGNLWLGVSVEDQPRADERIPLLLQTPAAVRFLSCEPLLGPVDLTTSKWNWEDEIDWVIVGGESGLGARPCNIAWIRSIIEQCKSAGVSCFVKQLGANVTGPRELWPNGWAGKEAIPLDGDRIPLRDKKGGDPAEWPADLRVREFPEQATVVSK